MSENKEGSLDVRGAVSAATRAPLRPALGLGRRSLVSLVHVLQERRLFSGKVLV